MRRAAGGPERRRAAPLLLGGDAAVPARCKLGSASAQGLFDDGTIGANASTPYHVKLTRAAVLVVSIKPRPSTLQRKYSYLGSASSSYGTLRKEGYVQEPRALDLATPRHMGILSSKVAGVVGGSECPVLP